MHLIIPGPGPRETVEAQGIVHRLPATPILATDYSLMWSRPPIARLLERLRPDRVEVSDRGTLRWVARWAKFHGVKSVMISHENMTGIMTRRTPLPDAAARWFADFSNRGNLTDFDRIVAPSRYAAQEFLDIGGRCDVVPLGVDLETFQPRPNPRPSRRTVPSRTGARPTSSTPVDSQSRSSRGCPSRPSAI